ncbi:MAG: hypothetical protein AB1627_08645 [Chloroflexota bacterium]
MTTHKAFKRRVRTRMAKTGESYTAARRQLLEHADAPPPETAPAAASGLDPVEAAGSTRADAPATAGRDPAAPPTSDDSVVRVTGRNYAAWYGLLDAWGAAARGHTATAAWLAGEHGVPGWWAQSITVAYERVRGLRARHQMPGGFEVTVVRTLAADPEQALRAFTDEQTRERWLPGSGMRQRPTSAAGVARFDWPEPASRLMVAVVAKGPGRATVNVVHAKLADAAAAEERKAFWRERLEVLRSFLEHGPAATE